MTPVYSFQRGEPIAWGVRVTSGDPTGVTASAALKAAPATSNDLPGAADPVVANFTAQFTPAAGAVPAYWTFTIAPAASAGLTPGRYYSDAKLVFGGNVIAISNPVLIVVKGSVSG